jgi:hypothetical protein
MSDEGLFRVFNLRSGPIQPQSLLRLMRPKVDR